MIALKMVRIYIAIIYMEFSEQVYEQTAGISMDPNNAP